MGSTQVDATTDTSYLQDSQRLGDSVIHQDEDDQSEHTAKISNVVNRKKERKKKLGQQYCLQLTPQGDVIKCRTDTEPILDAFGHPKALSIRGQAMKKPSANSAHIQKFDESHLNRGTEEFCLQLTPQGKVVKCLASNVNEGSKNEAKQEAANAPELVTGDDALRSANRALESVIEKGNKGERPRRRSKKMNHKNFHGQSTTLDGLGREKRHRYPTATRSTSTKTFVRNTGGNLKTYRYDNCEKISTLLEMLEVASDCDENIETGEMPTSLEQVEATTSNSDENSASATAALPHNILKNNLRLQMTLGKDGGGRSIITSDSASDVDSPAATTVIKKKSENKLAFHLNLDGDGEQDEAASGSDVDSTAAAVTIPMPKSEDNLLVMRRMHNKRDKALLCRNARQCRD